ncbi:hypothetical protein D8674_025869 [Pyrus ussuriensis x Pyrus communis]|uniref:Uncharacterized protein n=1 Tax=Pyrus ussuriensis x Pyrus communis TaxID=2448454 RepID=A0A5N5I569_9ROSA|nr:hypothetical protein D8674_025869 [Pyrus ussuriensis x Pyrus communis]
MLRRERSLLVRWTHVQKTLLLENQLSPTVVQETKLSKNARLATYARARGCPNPRWGWASLSHIAITKPTTSIEDSNNMDTIALSSHSPNGIDNTALKGVENPIIFQGTGGWLDAAMGDK